MPKLPFLILLPLLILLLPLSQAFARTTPEDIVNSQKEAYTQKIQNYSPENKQKLADWDKKIETFNDLKSNELEENMLIQGAILDEFIRRNEINEKLKTDGKTRNLANPIENARYYLTYAHEAVAYQAAHVYIFNPTGEANINQNILTTINQMESDLNVLKGKVQKSQDIIKQLINNNEG